MRWRDVAAPCIAAYAGILAVTSTACAGSPRHPSAAPSDTSAIAYSLLLVGDAGAPAVGDEPVLLALRAAAAQQPESTLVIFLGDNLYPDGMPPVKDAWRPEAERRLGAQIAAVRDAGARAIFLPGNHDWRRGASGLAEQEAFIAAKSAGTAELLPTGGCPGPVVRQATARLRLILLDTSWWFRDDRPASCDSANEQQWERALSRAFAVPHSGETLVLAHHPLESRGRHGGHYPWYDHLFPLRHAHPALWLPLPLIGSLYPVSRMLGIADQDLTSSRYGSLRQTLRRAMRAAPPLLYAAGHEHNLQVLPGSVAGYLLVSGAGIFDHATAVPSDEATLYTHDEAGFMRVDELESGRLRLTVLTVDAGGATTEVFSTWLESTASHAADAPAQSR